MSPLWLWTPVLMAVLVLSSLGVSEPAVKKVSGSVPLRQKREWIWNSLYVEEEKPAPIPYKIGQLKSSQRVDVKKFKIEGEGANSIFRVDNKGELLVTTSLDREEKNSYHLIATMYDGNNKLIEDAGEFDILVTDINDNKPVFPRIYSGSIAERSPIGTHVETVTATDADDPTTANGELRYSLTPDGDLSAFEVDSVTGEIRCRTSKLDRERQSQYVVVVQAQDMRGMASGSTSTTSVTITVDDVNDNIASFTTQTFELQVPEDVKPKEKIGTLKLEDKDLENNKEPIFLLPKDISKMFGIELNRDKDGELILMQALDYETSNSFTFTVQVHENPQNLHSPADNAGSAVTTAQVSVQVLDVDEPPLFSKPVYTFSVTEEQSNEHIGKVSARDPDAAAKSIRFSIADKDCPIRVHPFTGQLSTARLLDRELEAAHVCQVTAQEEPDGLQAFAKINITVEDINDNKPELAVDEIFICENDAADTVIGTLRATDKDEQLPSFSFALLAPSTNFSIRDHGDNTASVIVKQGPFSLADPSDLSLDVRVSDGGRPALSSTTKMAIKACRCDARRVPTVCKTAAPRMGVSVSVLTAILLCILTILVVVLLLVLRKRYQKDSLAALKSSGEIHEQLVTYDEEGGGEMDTNGYDVSILSSACQDGSLLRQPSGHARPSLYAMVRKPTACKGDMAAMIDAKKDEADHDRDGFPYDTLHIYGYEGTESLAGSLSSMDSSSTASDLDYDFLDDWGPRFRPLAQLYGTHGHTHHY